MKSDFESLMVKKTDDELRLMVEDWETFESDAVLAAIDELIKRDYEFSPEDLAELKANLTVKKKKEKRNSNSMRGNWNNNVTFESDAPFLYSQNAIYSFGIFFGVLFASFMIAANLERLKIKRGFFEVIGFGVVYTILHILFIKHIHVRTGSVLFNIPGAVILNLFFWNKYIGRDFKYQKRNVWPALLIGLAFIFLLIIWLFVSITHNR